MKQSLTVKDLKEYKKNHCITSIFCHSAFNCHSLIFYLQTYVINGKGFAALFIVCELGYLT